MQATGIEGSVETLRDEADTDGDGRNKPTWIPEVAAPIQIWIENQIVTTHQRKWPQNGNKQIDEARKQCPGFHGDSNSADWLHFLAKVCGDCLTLILLLLCWILFHLLWCCPLWLQRNMAFFSSSSLHSSVLRRNLSVSKLVDSILVTIYKLHHLAFAVALYSGYPDIFFRTN